VAAGALAGRARTSLILTVAVVVGAALCGDLMWYSLGRWRGRRAMGILCRLSPGSARCIHHAESLFLAHRTGSC
jgi:membrane protein DedA with SNARE-associated domain